MSPPSESSPYAELEKVFAIVQNHDLAHIEPAIETAMKKYRGNALEYIYAEALLWSKTFLLKAKTETDRSKRKKLTDYVLRGGTIRRQAQNAADTVHTIDPIA